MGIGATRATHRSVISNGLIVVVGIHGYQAWKWSQIFPKDVHSLPKVGHIVSLILRSKILSSDGLDARKLDGAQVRCLGVECGQLPAPMHY